MEQYNPTITGHRWVLSPCYSRGLQSLLLRQPPSPTIVRPGIGLMGVIGESGVGSWDIFTLWPWVAPYLHLYSFSPLFPPSSSFVLWILRSVIDPLIKMAGQHIRECPLFRIHLNICTSMKCSSIILKEKRKLSYVWSHVLAHLWGLGFEWIGRLKAAQTY